MANINRIVSRYASAVQLDPKMQALLLKLRKGADSSLSLGQLIKVLALLGGWRVEEMVGLTPLHYENSTHALRIEGDEEKAKAIYGQLKALEVSALPTNPKLGQFYIMDLEPFQKLVSQWEGVERGHGAKYKLWAGVPGIRFTDPEGKVFELLPDRHTIHGGQSIDEREQGLPNIDPKRLKKLLMIYNLMKWLKEHTTYVAQINEVLGLEEHIPAAKRMRDNTGTCAVCFRNIKLVARGESYIMALHGYNRPGSGFVVGRCWGGDHAPYELSSEATALILDAVEDRLTANRKYLETLSSPDLNEFDAHKWFGGTTHEIHQKGTDSHWVYNLREHVRATEGQIQKVERERNIYKWLIDNWKMRELPREGDKEIDWFGVAYRSSK